MTMTSISEDLVIKLPDSTVISTVSHPWTRTLKALIEDFGFRYLERPKVLWIRGGNPDLFSMFLSLIESVGLYFGKTSDLPSLILQDEGRDGRLWLCEIGTWKCAVTEARKEALLNLVRIADIPEGNVRFVTAFEGRESPAFLEFISTMAVDSMVWFRTEPDMLVTLQRSTTRQGAV
ncbi:hypothetical protein GMSM_10050 [Geomonas sp. Red276]